MLHRMRRSLLCLAGCMCLTVGLLGCLQVSASSQVSGGVTNEQPHTYRGSSHSTSGQEEIVDEIRAVIYGEKDTAIVVTSDIKPHLDGSPRELYDCIIDRLVELEAIRFNLPSVTDDEIERHIEEKIIKGSGVPRFELEQLMNQAGYTYEQGKEYLRRRKIMERVLEVRVSSDPRLRISREDVAAYEAEHPAYTTPVYTLVQAVVSDDMYDKELSAEELDSIDWEEPFEVAEDELADDKAFLKHAKPGDIVDRDRVPHGCELTRLQAVAPARRKTVDERYDEIAGKLYNQRFAEVFTEFQQQLLRDYVIRFTHEEDRSRVMSHA